MKELDTESLLRDLHLATGMSIQLSDAQFHSLSFYGSGRGYCALLHDVPEALEHCMRSDLQAFHRVRETGKQYTYTCPFGLFTALTPIREGKQIVGYLYIGGALDEAEGLELPWRCVRERLGEFYAPQQLAQKMEELPRANSERLEAICELARFVCAYIEQNAAFPAREASIATLAEKYILQNLNTKITLGRICLALHCSKATLTESFRRENGITVVQFLNEKRLERAATLLIQSSLSVGQVAQECGFSGVEYFSAQFKRRFGRSPLSFRKAQRAGENLN